MDKNEGRGNESASKRDVSGQGGDEGEAMNAARHLAPGSDQRPVSVIGWSLALLGGALIWALILGLVGLQ